VYAAGILAAAGVKDPQAAAISLAATHCVSTTVCMVTSDRLPRCGKRVFLRHFMPEIIFLPRQARDKHRETSKRRRVFLPFRRTLLALSAAGMAVSAALLSVCIGASSSTAPDTAGAAEAAAAAALGGGGGGCTGRVSMSALIFYVFSFGVGVGPLPFVIVSECLPQEIRGKKIGAGGGGCPPCIHTYR
jgi:hypothetical protein